jgi:hypothetical protein
MGLPVIESQWAALASGWGLAIHEQK